MLRFTFNTQCRHGTPGKNTGELFRLLGPLVLFSDWLDAVYYLSSGACGWIVMIGIVMISSSCCNGCEGKKTRRCTSLVMLIWCKSFHITFTIGVFPIFFLFSNPSNAALYIDTSFLLIEYKKSVKTVRSKICYINA